MNRVVSVLLPFTASAIAIAPAGPMALSGMGKKPGHRDDRSQCMNDIAHTGDRVYALECLLLMSRVVSELLPFTASAIASAPAGPMSLAAMGKRAA